LLFKNVIKAADALEAAFESDLGNSQIRACQKRDGMVGAIGIQIIVEGHREKTIERLGKIAVIISEMRRDLLEGQRLFEICLYIFHNIRHKHAAAVVSWNKLDALEILGAEGIKAGLYQHNVVRLIFYKIFKQKSVNRFAATETEALSRFSFDPFLEFMYEILGEDTDPYS
jgi:hypothetical protein